MWPYTDDEAGWLTPERAPPIPVNDNDPTRRVPVRLVEADPGQHGTVAPIPGLTE